MTDQEKIKKLEAALEKATVALNFTDAVNPFNPDQNREFSRLFKEFDLAYIAAVTP